jgi:PAS domain S-box-containing protein
MPRSAIATGAADFILPAEEIPGRIAEIAHGTCRLPARTCRTTILDEELHTIFTLVKGHTGHDFSSYKPNTVMRRIERRMSVNDVAGLGKYIAFLRETPQEAHALYQDILIGVTSFFRDPDAFAIIRREIIPQLFAGRDPDDPVRIWHACCATGEEVYSMAILIREYLDEARLGAKVQFFASDIDPVAVAQARAGLYGDDIVADVGEERLKTFFTRSDGRWQVAKQLREMIVFAHHSLIKDPPFSRLDLLVCRNFLIYLNPDMQKRLIALFHQVLKPRGFLFLGAAETVGQGADLFIPFDKKWKIFERPESDRRAGMHFPFTAPVRRPPVTRRTTRAAGAEEASPGGVAEKLLMERYSPPYVVVNEKYEVVHVSTRANRYLEVPVGEPTRDILRMAREELRPALRAAIYKSFAEESQVGFRGVQTDINDGKGSVNVLVEPIAVSASAGKLAMVVFEPAPPPKLPAPADGEEPPAGDETSKDVLIRQLEQQLRITHEQLQATSEQLESTHEGFMSANEELMSINEEFQSGNEELQSTNEELETSKEELQALNEELVTVNAELQGKVEELDRINSDMENLLTSSEIATLFLDRTLHIKRFTPAVAELFNLLPADIGRPFRHLAGKIDWSSFENDAETVLAGHPCVEQEAATLDRERCYLKRLYPYRSEGRIEGLVVTFIDISERKLFEAQTVHLASFPQLNPNPVLEVDAAGKVIFANPATNRILEGLGMAENEVEAFLPPDLGEILRNWDRVSETTGYREIVIGERVFGETLFLTPRFEVARIYAFDITERKKSEEALRESEERVRHKLESIVFPEGDLSNLDLADIIDARSLQSLVDDFYRLTGMPMGLIDIKGKVLVGVGWQDICTKFHRVHPETCENCIESDTLLSADIPPGEFKVYKCKNNLWDVATPVMVGDRHVGNLFMGQFFFEDEPIDYEFFRSQARQYGFEEKAYIASLEAVPRLSRETLNTSMSFFMKLAGLLSKLSYSNLNLARSLAERDALMDSLQKNEERFRTMFERHKAVMLLIDPESGAIVNANAAAAELYGYSRDKLREMKIQDLNQLPPEEVAAERQRVVKEQRTHFVFPHRIASGEVRWVEVYSTPIEAKGTALLFSIIHDITERRRAEEALRESRERLDLALASSRMSTFDWDIVNNKRTWSDGVHGLLGTKPETFTGTAEEFFQIIHPEDRSSVQANLEKAVETTGVYETEYRAVWPDGSIHHISARGKVHSDDAGRAVLLAGVCWDITDRKRVEEELRKAHDELEERVKQRTIELATTIETLLGEVAERERAEENLRRLNRLYAVLSETAQAIARTGDRDTLFREFCRVAMEEGGFLLSWIGLVDGETGLVTMTAASGATAYLDDIRITTNEEPAGEGPTGISVRQGTHYICNDFQNDPCTRPWHERGRAHGIRASASIALKQDGRVVGALTLYSGEKDFFDSLQEKLLIQLGEEISFALNSFEQASRRREAELALQKETMERLQALELLRTKEQMLIQQSRLAALGEMIGNIAHQWRQPLNILGLILQELSITYEPGAFTREQLDDSVAKSLQIISHMSQTIDGFRNFFRPDKEMTAFNLKDVIFKTVNLVEASLREQRIGVDIDVRDDLVIDGFPNEYAQVVLNILLNSRDAFLDRKIDAERLIQITIVREEGKSVVTIADNAGGISGEIMGKIYDPYFTTKGPDKGTGVGLFMSKTIIEKNMSGRLSACNSGEGATFKIEV